MTSEHEDATTPLPDLPIQPQDVDWPTTAWPAADPSVVDAGSLTDAVGAVFACSDPSVIRTDALVVIQAGQVVVERYGTDVTAQTTLPSWSMAKSFTAVLYAMAGLDPSLPANVPEWADDDRGAITGEDLLRMLSGLQWSEIYEADQPSDVVTMLFGDGQGDTAHFAASKPLTSPPGTTFEYSSGTTNIVSRMVADRLGHLGEAEAMADAMRARLFGPIGMTSATPKFDAGGTFIGSSFCYATALDFARFGLLCLRGGRWNESQLVPEGWIDWCRTPTAISRAEGEITHGAHFWCLEDQYGTFGCHGYEGQYIWMSPALDLVVVRSGFRNEQNKDTVLDDLRSVMSCFAQ